MNYNFTQYMKFLMFMRYKLIVDKDYPNLDWLTWKHSILCIYTYLEVTENHFNECCELLKPVYNEQIM